jgi:hypothetical protein
MAAEDFHNVIDLLKLSDETDLDILNRSMEVMVDAFQTELLPVAAQLTARLVCGFRVCSLASHHLLVVDFFSTTLVLLAVQGVFFPFTFGLSSSFRLGC